MFSIHSWALSRYVGDCLMSHSITLSDEQYDRLQAAAALLRRTPEQVVADLLGGLPYRTHQQSREEYEQRWETFFQLVGSIRQGGPVTNEEIDEVLGEEAADPHDSSAADTGHA
jgi:hypothetical protein